MTNRPIYILGPCSAENREQVLITARQLLQACGVQFVFRAGAWKPRTNPHTFQGAGEDALLWLREVKETLGIPVATEVASPEHVQKAVAAGIDYLWLGARTGASPIAVQEIANAIKGHDVKGVLVKNPVNADADLWIGNIERLESTGIPVMAIHRGCNHQPCWAMAHAVRSARPDIPLLIDPSHMSGEAAQIRHLLTKAEKLNYDGAMVEIHCCPDQALSDSRQQLSPESFRDILEECPRHLRDVSKSDTELQWLRAEIDELDDCLWETLASRMDVSTRIGEWKKAHGVTPLQPERYAEILEKRKIWAQQNGIENSFIEQIFDLIHRESIKRQE